MFSKKSKILIYILFFLLILNFMLPFHTFAIDEDSIYVWSNNSSSISTSNTVTEETNAQDNSRKLFRNHFWWCYINRPKNWEYLV